MTEPLLSLSKLSIHYPSQTEKIAVVDTISFTVGQERVALVGESGSGKSMTARAIMGLVRKPGQVTAEHLRFQNQNLLDLNTKQINQIRGSKIAMVLQDPRYALNPALTVGQQIEESLKIHRHRSRADRRDKIDEALLAVGLQPAIARSYPNELSGGMGQRAMLAIALINNPLLLIADEPTSALDAKLRNQILELIVEQCEQRKMGLLLISHDLPLVAEHCDRVLVMYQGQLVDQSAASLLPQSTHPYTQTLWRCRPSAATYGTVLPVLDRTLNLAGVEHGTD